MVETCQIRNKETLIIFLTNETFDHIFSIFISTGFYSTIIVYKVFWFLSLNALLSKEINWLNSVLSGQRKSLQQILLLDKKVFTDCLALNFSIFYYNKFFFSISTLICLSFLLFSFPEVSKPLYFLSRERRSNVNSASFFLDFKVQPKFHFLQFLHLKFLRNFN